MEDLRKGMDEKGLIDFVKTCLLSGSDPRGKEAVKNLEWGIKQYRKHLILHGVVGSKDVQLMRDSMLKSREETAKAREYSAIKQTLEIYCNDDELPTVNEVLERIGRKH